MPLLADDTRIARPQGLVASTVDNEVVILEMTSGHFFHLNSGGSRIWDLLDAPMTLQDVCTALQARFQVEDDDCRRDVAEFVEVMQARGLLELT